MSNNKKLTKEASAIWAQNFGKSTSRVIDFAGRTIDKGAYDNKNSDFAWNIDHIQPISLGGSKSDEKNMICCHILTNTEKGSSYPEFTANNKKFKVIEESDGFKKIVEISNKDNYSIDNLKKIMNSSNNNKISLVTKIRIRDLISKKVIDFIYDLYKNENVSVVYSQQQENWNNDTLKSYYNAEITIKVYDVDTEIFEIDEQLKNNLKLYTVFDNYFLKKKYLSSFWISFDLIKETNEIDLLIESESKIVFDINNFNSFVVNKEILRRLKKDYVDSNNNFVEYNESDEVLIKQIKELI